MRKWVREHRARTSPAAYFRYASDTMPRKGAAPAAPRPSPVEARAETDPPVPHAEELRRLLSVPAAAWSGAWRRELAGISPASLPALARRLIEASLDLVHRDTGAAERAALAARACARAAQGLPESSRADLRAEATAVVANCRRVQSDLVGAGQLWRRVDGLACLGTREPAQEARIASLKASLYRDQRKFTEAVDELLIAIDRARLADQDGAKARYRLQLAETLRAKGSPRAALAQVRKAQRYLGDPSVAQLAFGALHQEILIRNDLGQNRQALALSRVLAPHYATYAGPVFQLRGAWLRGRLYASVGEHGQATEIFEELKAGFLAREMLYDAALVSLDLALAYAERGERGRVRSLAHEMYDVFRAQQIPREAAAALLLFAHNALDELADAAFIAETIRQLDAQRPGLAAHNHRTRIR